MGFDGKALPNKFLTCMADADRKAGGKALQTLDEAQARLEGRAERELQNHLANLLRLYGIEANRSRMDKKKTDRVGWPDFTFAAKGRAIAWEVKIPGKGLDPEQVKCIAAMRSEPNCWHVEVIHSVEEGTASLKALGIIRP